MGGYGSSRWGFYRKKTVVEDCLKLPIGLIREGLEGGKGHRGAVNWTLGGRVKASISYTVEAGGIRLSYRVGGEQGQDCSYFVALTETFPRLGGVRYWFVCPLRGCGQRVGTLYLPPGGRYFGCRHCYDLAYTSAQEAHKWDSLDRKLGMAGAARLLSRRWAAGRRGSASLG